MEGCYLVIGPQLQNHAVCCPIMELGPVDFSPGPVGITLNFGGAAGTRWGRGEWAWSSSRFCVGWKTG